MKQLLVLTLTFAFLASSAMAAPAAAPTPATDLTPATPETPVNEVEIEADSQALVPTEQEENAPATEQVEIEGLSTESELRQDASGYHYRCSHPIMCPGIPFLPVPQCINGWCVYE